MIRMYGKRGPSLHSDDNIAIIVVSQLRMSSSQDKSFLHMTWNIFDKVAVRSGMQPLIPGTEAGSFWEVWG